MYHYLMLIQLLLFMNINPRSRNFPDLDNFYNFLHCSHPGRAFTMGGDRVRMKLDSYEKFKNEPLLWKIFVEGGLASFLECLNEHVESLSI